MNLPENIEIYTSQTIVTKTTEIYMPESIRKGLASSGLAPQGMFVFPGLKQTVSFDSAKDNYRLSSGFIPQGICTAGKYILLTAYDHVDNSSKKPLNSVIYVCSLADGKYITTIVTPGRSHMGGICYDEKKKFIWYSNGAAVAGFSYDSLEKIAALCETVGNIAAVRMVSAEKNFKALKQASFLTCFDGLVWIGTFSSSDTGEIYGYSYEKEGEALTPVINMEAPTKAQGMCFYEKDGAAYLAVSCSYGIMTSTVRLYKTAYESKDKEAALKEGKCRTVLKHTAYSVLKFPHGLENIAVNGNRVYIMFESAKVMTKNPLCKIDRVIKYKARDFFGIS